MNARLRSAFLEELAAAGRAEQESDPARAWRHLERAHVLSQAYAWRHLRVHGRMFAFAWRRRDGRELLGQLPRLLLAAPGSWTGRAPRRSAGGTDVGTFTPMEIPTDLQALLPGVDSSAGSSASKSTA
jgi:hypothetical protein